ncbi:peroxide stress protein YaaA [Roseiconus nitratireducens]|uniref:UPF0246 protein FYK55_15635 n=1 Tax=Roseiconus nitratireducens TaxID=2605748 RepID=A0A5M6D7I0_9BACT|nr:peroxide stress protein YaaA [Roseiconus nitratireducens]KAA5542232.1 peroxide stress protein YaaA [Roseiconus nitratireducens]
MLIVLSPAKTLDYDTPAQTKKITEPALLADSAQLVDRLKELSQKQLKALMGISDDLAELNHDRFQHWESPMPRDAVKQAVLAFKGDVYRGLQADQMTEKQLLYAQDHLRILSGLYGVLRPLDAMLPYRLEMGTPLKNARGKDLYDFWGTRLTELINEQLSANKSRILLNLASQEYFRSLDADRLQADVVSPVFKDEKNGTFKVITVYAKQARGTMASWVIRTRAKTLKKLIQFDEEGYRYDPDSSTPSQPVFLRSS